MFIGLENYDLKTTAWRKQDLNATDGIQKKIWLGNQMMLTVKLRVLTRVTNYHAPDVA